LIADVAFHFPTVSIRRMLLQFVARNMVLGGKFLPANIAFGRLVSLSKMPLECRNMDGSEFLLAYLTLDEILVHVDLVRLSQVIPSGRNGVENEIVQFADVTILGAVQFLRDGEVSGELWLRFLLPAGASAIAGRIRIVAAGTISGAN